MANVALKDEQQQLIKCWGDDIEEEGTKTKKYLSYIVKKENFESIKKYISDSKVDLKKYDYVEIIYDQLVQKIIFDFNSESGDEAIVETSLGFYIVIK
jgi:hypothetical protein